MARAWLHRELRQQIVATFRGHQGGIRDATFSPDGRILATVSEDGTKLWHGATDDEVLVQSQQGKHEG